MESLTGQNIITDWTFFVSIYPELLRRNLTRFRSVLSFWQYHLADHSAEENTILRKGETAEVNDSARKSLERAVKGMNDAWERARSWTAGIAR